MYEHALQYIGRRWHIFRLTGYKTPLKGTHGFKDASIDPSVIQAWWALGQRRQPNIGIATGFHDEASPNLLCLDADGPGGLEDIRKLAVPHGGLPRTLTAQTSRGFHFYFTLPVNIRLRSSNAKREVRGGDGIDIRADGGYTILPPSVNAKTGFTYRWVLDLPLAEAPAWLIAWCQQRGGERNRKLKNASPPEQAANVFGQPPAWLLNKGEGYSEDLTGRALRAERRTELPDLLAALRLIPADPGYEQWFKVGAAIYDYDPSDDGLAIFKAWSWSAPGYRDEVDVASCEKKWVEYSKDKGDRVLITKASIYKWAEDKKVEEATVEPEAFVAENASGGHDKPPGFNEEAFKASFQPAEANGYSFNGHAGAAAGLGQGTFENPLIDLNNKYAVIGDVGSKCLVLSWVPSKVDQELRVPSFQTFKSFSERYANQYVTLQRVDDHGQTKEEVKQLGSHWLKWPKRRSFEGIDLIPGGPPIAVGNVLNLWSGFAVQPRGTGEGEPGWEKMKWHIANILAGGDPAAATYIFKFAAWCVQYPGERAEVALVFKGGKGSGKGTFANALKRIFGQHGLQIFNSKHLVGSFNGHLRNCLLLFADEAFWAGDKAGESTLKGMLTEPALMIEQKGVDAAPWRNRLKVIMAANADWVVPASHDERRYAMFDVSDEKIGDRQYFKELHFELLTGGLAAMLHDLLQVELGDWHPREVIENTALHEQKERSLSPLQEWYVELLEEGRLPGRSEATKNKTGASVLLMSTRDHFFSSRPLSATALGRFLTSHKNTRLHTREGSLWIFPELKAARHYWELKYKGWTWANNFEEWF